MRRREFILALGGAATWPLEAHAQKSSSIARVGILATANPRSVSFYQSFEQRLRELGYIEGQNIAFEYRDAGGVVDRLPKLAGEIVYSGVDVILTATDPATRAAKEATVTVPIIMIAINYDPVALGYVTSFARPGSNITGLFFQHLGVTVKRLELFKEMLPDIRRVAVFTDPQTTDQLDEVHTASRSLDIELQQVDLRNPPYDFEDAFRAAMRLHAEALFVLEAASIFRERTQITTLAMRNRLPTSFAFREYVEAGGLISYGVNFASMFRRAAEYAHRILQGAKPADLPVEQASRFELVINLKTAQGLGLTVPDTLLDRADEVIE